MKNKYISGYIVLSGLLVLSLFWGYNQYDKNRRYDLYLENQYQRMFNDMVINLEDIQSDLAKAVICSSSNEKVMLFSEISSLSYDAQEKLCQLPVRGEKLLKTRKFLSQIGDISTVLARKKLKGINLSAKDISTLEQLHNYANDIAKELLDIQTYMNDNNIKIHNLSNKINAELTNGDRNLKGYAHMEERIQEYPTLIYDGPFSEHRNDRSFIMGGQSFSKDEAIKKVRDFYNLKEASIEKIEEFKFNNDESYLVVLNNNKERITCAITKNGGHMIWMLSNKDSESSTITKEEGIKKAKKFLSDKNLSNMVETYYMEYDNEILINFAYKQDNIIAYPDLIKVKVSLYDGDITGFESQGYLYNHKSRDINNLNIISERDARNKLSTKGVIEKIRLVVIPTIGQREKVCYEIKVSYKRDTFLIYINAVSGVQENILQIIDTDKGVIVM